MGYEGKGFQRTTKCRGLALELSWLTNDSKATVSVLFWYILLSISHANVYFGNPAPTFKVGAVLLFLDTKECRALESTTFSRLYFFKHFSLPPLSPPIH
jgi:hypothetical protein